MISGFLINRTIMKHVKQYNNRQLRDTYLVLKKKINKTHTDKLFIDALINEMKKRGIINNG